MDISGGVVSLYGELKKCFIFGRVRDSRRKA